MTTRLLIGALISVVCMCSFAVGATPTLVSYQGLLTNASGDPVPDASYSVRFTIYADSVGGFAHWQEVKSITTSDGLFSTNLGSNVALSDWVFTSKSRFLGIKIGSDPEIAPRTRLTSVPYSFRVSTIDSATGGTIAGGMRIQPSTFKDSGDVITILRGTSEVSATIKVNEIGSTEIDFFDPVDSKELAITKKLHLGTDGIVLFGATTSDTTVRISDDGNIRTFGGVGIDTAPPNANLHVVGRGEFIDITRSEYAGPADSVDWTGVYGRGVPIEGWGYGGYFQGGYMGVRGRIDATGEDSYFGVYGSVYGGTGTNHGVYGWAAGGATNWAGYFNGDCRVTGNFDNSKSGTVIDHPEDPANKYLYHSSVISPEMKTVYDGVAVLDSDGQAVVDLPGYFDKLNENFRYQLTCIGGYAPLYIADEISDNQFRIAGGQPRMRVSWQVTGVRSDAFAKANPIQVEKEKLEKERGKYLNPEAFGLDERSGVDSEIRERSEEPADRRR